LFLASEESSIVTGTLLFVRLSTSASLVFDTGGPTV
jgi:hypothetical protein